ncbi:MAG: hybrid sensor histidine kinase/response regulator [Richelia sp.]|nr:hybrid sensor histidine kinase/response regulator [Richelia sp.]
MLNQSLCEFITGVPGCLETSVIAMVLNLFQEHQCDRIVIFNQQRTPIGVVRAVSILPRLVNVNNTNHLESETKNLDKKELDLQQEIVSLGKEVIDPITTFSSDCSLEQLSFLISSTKKEAARHLDWGLVDGDGKFLGLLDTDRFLQFVLQQQINRDNTTTEKAKLPINLEDKALVQLLETLPWPLMLQTATGKVLMQNPAWWQQLGNVKNPESIRQQIKAILNQSEGVLASHEQHSPGSQQVARESIAFAATENTIPNCESVTTVTTEKSLPDKLLSPTPPHRCFWDYQLGTCICVVTMADNQERIWEFAKIPLDIVQMGGESNHRSPNPDNSLWLVLATDVTEQKQVCQELATKNADLIQLNRLKDEFLSCISHELKTPLTAVLGLSRLLVDQQLGKLNERQARYAGLIHQSGRHLMSIVNDILDLTSMETGQMELTLAPVNIHTVCDRAYKEVSSLHNQTNKNKHSPAPETNQEHKFTLTIESGLHELIADELRLRQMLVNLLSNALKFTQTSGEVGLTINYWEGWIAFTVWDTGIGIPEHQQHLIFQKFQQLENPLTRQFEGTGLGLVLTRALARLHGGDVSFISTEGKGSKFTLLLPPCPPNTDLGEDDSKDRNKLKGNRNNSLRYHAENLHNHLAVPTLKDSLDSSFWENRRPLKNYLLDSAPSTLNYQQDMGMGEVSMLSASNHPRTNQRLVLVVEAVARYIEDLRGKLIAFGYRVIIARSGTEALEKARRLQPQVIFLNPLLPLLSGWDVLTLIKSDRNIRQIPVIVTATAAEKEQAFTNFANGFLSLPIQKQLLAQLLEQLCELPEKKQPEHDNRVTTHIPLRILRLIHSPENFFNPHPHLPEHRVIEVDDLEQAELLARVWKFDLILIDREINNPQTYLQKLSQRPRLKKLPLVICDTETTKATANFPEFSVFPCLTAINTDAVGDSKTTEILLSVLQIAAGRCCPPNILVVDVTSLPDLPGIKYQYQEKYKDRNKSSHLLPEVNLVSIHRGSEWLQALIQYLQTAGLKATLGRYWAEIIQQLRHKSVDLLLLYLTEDTISDEVLSALKTLRELIVDLPPILVIVSVNHTVLPTEIDSNSSQEINLDNVKVESHYLQTHILQSIKAAMGQVTTQLLPYFISMEELLDNIYQTLKIKK